MELAAVSHRAEDLAVPVGTEAGAEESPLRVVVEPGAREDVDGVVVAVPAVEQRQRRVSRQLLHKVAVAELGRRRRQSPPGDLVAGVERPRRQQDRRDQDRRGAPRPVEETAGEALPHQPIESAAESDGEQRQRGEQEAQVAAGDRPQQPVCQHPQERPAGARPKKRRDRRRQEQQEERRRGGLAVEHLAVQDGVPRDAEQGGDPAGHPAQLVADEIEHRSSGAAGSAPPAIEVAEPLAVAEELGIEGKERASGLVPDPQVPRPERQERGGREGGEIGRTAAPERLAERQETDRGDEEKPQVLGAGGEAAESPRQPQPPPVGGLGGGGDFPGEDRRGGEECQAEVDVGGAGHPHDQRRPQPQRRRPQAGAPGEEPPSPGGEDRRGQQHLEEVHQVSGGISREAHHRREQHFVEDREDREAQGLGERQTVRREVGGGERQVVGRGVGLGRRVEGQKRRRQEQGEEEGGRQAAASAAGMSGPAVPPTAADHPSDPRCGSPPDPETQEMDRDQESEDRFAIEPAHQAEEKEKPAEGAQTQGGGEDGRLAGVAVGKRAGE